MLLQHGWTVQELWWQVPDDFSQVTVYNRIAWVERQVAQAIDAEAGACRLLIGKSLGSLACTIAADRNIAAAWLTPCPEHRPSGPCSPGAQAPTPLIGGSGDKLWDSRIAESLHHDVLEVPSADHSLELADDAAGSVDVLRHVVSRMDRFIGSLSR
ncbi:alpha/beta hydrolase [Streptomyces sp. NPDC020719]|uniref:alpha/beta hydrolase n=1 Tax=Streptomyces sp. NPDC020719 TaxID=3154896 RepID=UPI0033F5696E